MTRGLTPAQLSAAAARHRIAVPLIEVFFDSGALRITLGQWNLVYAGNTYVSTVLVEFKQQRESGGSVEGLEMTVDGVSTAIMTIASQEQVRGKVVRQMKALLDPDTYQIIDDPKVQFLGRVSSMPITETNNLCAIKLTAEHYDAELGRAAPKRLNDADHQRIHPTDLGCQYVETMVEKILVWPSRDAFKV